MIDAVLQWRAVGPSVDAGMNWVAMNFVHNLRRSSHVFAVVALVASSGKDERDGYPIGSLQLLGSASIPTGRLFEGVEFGGISGLDRAADGSYWAISDDRGAPCLNAATDLLPAPRVNARE